MEPNPYRFSAANSRLVENAERSPKVMYAAAAIFMFSLHCYNRRWFRKDGNALNAFVFTAASVPASWCYANSMFSDAATEAAIMNNNKERQH